MVSIGVTQGRGAVYKESSISQAQATAYNSPVSAPVSTKTSTPAPAPVSSQPQANVSLASGGTGYASPTGQITPVSQPTNYTPISGSKTSSSSSSYPQPIPITNTSSSGTIIATPENTQIITMGRGFTSPIYNAPGQLIDVNQIKEGSSTVQRGDYTLNYATGTVQKFTPTESGTAFYNGQRGTWEKTTQRLSERPAFIYEQRKQDYAKQSLVGLGLEKPASSQPTPLTPSPTSSYQPSNYEKVLLDISGKSYTGGFSYYNQPTKTGGIGESSVYYGGFSALPTEGGQRAAGLSTINRGTILTSEKISPSKGLFTEIKNLGSGSPLPFGKIISTPIEKVGNNIYKPIGTMTTLKPSEFTDITLREVTSKATFGLYTPNYGLTPESYMSPERQQGIKIASGFGKILGAGVQGAEFGFAFESLGIVASSGSKALGTAIGGASFGNVAGRTTATALDVGGKLMLGGYVVSKGAEARSLYKSQKYNELGLLALETGAEVKGFNIGSRAAENLFSNFKASAPASYLPQFNSQRPDINIKSQDIKYGKGGEKIIVEKGTYSVKGNKYLLDTTIKLSKEGQGNYLSRLSNIKTNKVISTSSGKLDVSSIELSKIGQQQSKYQTFLDFIPSKGKAFSQKIESDVLLSGLKSKELGKNLELSSSNQYVRSKTLTYSKNIFGSQTLSGFDITGSKLSSKTKSSFNIKEEMNYGTNVLKITKNVNPISQKISFSEKIYRSESPLKIGLQNIFRSKKASFGSDTLVPSSDMMDFTGLGSNFAGRSSVNDFSVSNPISPSKPSIKVNIKSPSLNEPLYSTGSYFEGLSQGRFVSGFRTSDFQKASFNSGSAGLYKQSISTKDIFSVQSQIDATPSSQFTSAFVPISQTITSPNTATAVQSLITESPTSSQRIFEQPPIFNPPTPVKSVPYPVGFDILGTGGGSGLYGVKAPKRKRQYMPSVFGVLSGQTIKKAPKDASFTGLEMRLPVETKQVKLRFPSKNGSRKKR